MAAPLATSMAMLDGLISGYVDRHPRVTCKQRVGMSASLATASFARRVPFRSPCKSRHAHTAGAFSSLETTLGVAPAAKGAPKGADKVSECLP